MRAESFSAPRRMAAHGPCALPIRRRLRRYLVFKGSVSVEGISLTIAELTDDYFEIAIIPKTWEVTNFSHLQPGDDVNLEADVIAKYVERILAFAAELVIFKCTKTSDSDQQDAHR